MLASRSLSSSFITSCFLGDWWMAEYITFRTRQRTKGWGWVRGSKYVGCVRLTLFESSRNGANQTKHPVHSTSTNSMMHSQHVIVHGYRSEDAGGKRYSSTWDMALQGAPIHDEYSGAHHGHQHCWGYFRSALTVIIVFQIAVNIPSLQSL